MKKLSIFCMTALLAAALQGCGNGGENPAPNPPTPEPPDPEPKGTSIQAENKTISLPAENFPAIDVYAGEEFVTSFTLLEGNYAALKNGVEFNGNEFSKGVVIGEGDIITIKQEDVVLVNFEPKTFGAGAKIKITGIGSTSALTSAEGVGRGIYTFTAAEGAADANGMIKGGTIFAGGNINNKVTQISLEGGTDYLMRRDRLDLDRDIEGWAFVPVDMGNGFVCENINMMISIYAADNLTKAVADQVALYTAQPLPTSGAWDFILQNFVKKVKDNNDDRFYRVQGNGNISCWFRIGNGCNYDDYDFKVFGIPSSHENQNPFDRVYGPIVRFALYLTDTPDAIADTDLATSGQFNAFLSSDGLDPGDKSVALKVLNPEEAVNTQEPLVFVWTRKQGKINKIRFEGAAYDSKNECIVLTAGMTIRTL